MPMRQKPEKDKQERKTIKVAPETHKKLEEMGVGIGKAVDILVEERAQQVAEKVEEISELGAQIGEILLAHGVFDIRFAGAAIQNVDVQGENLEITCLLKIAVPDEEVRKAIIDAVKPQETEEEKLE
ncbi:hypothetical protein MUP59_02055 [Candidatus Bathyarchaeota archaeon]|nr:hypothetical protein [Candidatus Bathyarchaeota archaeon]